MSHEDFLFIVYAGFFIGALVFSLLINSIFIRFVSSYGMKTLRKQPMVRWSPDSKPTMGGITFFIVFLMSVVCYNIFIDPQQVVENKPLLGLVVASSLAFLMGLGDDAFNTRPFLKFFVQVFCGLILVGSGTSVGFFDSEWLNILFTVFWVVGLMNSINMLDNMDGITAIVSFGIIFTVFMTIILQKGFDSVFLMIVLGMLATLLGFLFFNWHPSKLFMGDTGSQLLGIFLAMIGIRFFFNASFPDGQGGDLAWKQVMTGVLVFLLPIVDTLVVVTDRLLRGRSPFIGGKDHTTHNFTYVGLSDSQVAMLFGGLTLFASFFSLMIIFYFEQWSPFFSFTFVLFSLGILVTFFYITHKNNKRLLQHDQPLNQPQSILKRDEKKKSA